MRAVAIFGPGSSEKDLRPFRQSSDLQWDMNLPKSAADTDAVVIFGGDGTVHRYLPQLVELGLPLLVVPRGSGNDFARALGLRSVRVSLSAWRRFLARKDNVRSIDVGLIRSITEPISVLHYFCTVAGVGLDGEVAQRANQRPRWLRGNGGYLLTLLPLLFRFAAFQVKVFSLGSENKTASKPALVAAFANVPSFGGGMKIAPRAKIDDGKLDVCVIGEINRFKLVCVLPTLYFGRHLGLTEVDYFQTERLRVETEMPTDVFADGEYVCQTPVEVGVVREKLRVITP